MQLNQLEKKENLERIDYDLLSDIQFQVLSYLEHRPDAADTAEGIRQWWVLHQIAQLSNERVQRALDQLVEQKLIESRVLDDGRNIFKRRIN
ncbi:MAG: hypothetical protein OEX19_16195 [Gammaproteobacteria bacterium]|nr:hypothetical protein [Gammaproteobacteria bacterium]